MPKYLGMPNMRIRNSKGLIKVRLFRSTGGSSAVSGAENRARAPGQVWESTRRSGSACSLRTQPVRTAARFV